MFSIGDIVSIKDRGHCYSCYYDKAKEMGLDINDMICIDNSAYQCKELSKAHLWKYDTLPENGDMCIVISLDKSQTHIGIKRIADNRQFIMSREGLKKSNKMTVDYYIGKELFEI